MKILQATKETQGQKKGDFCWIPEGEMVKFGTVCDSGCSCGCARAMVGVNCSKSTTTFKVVETSMSVLEIVRILQDSYTREGWQALVPKTAKEFIEDVKEMADIAAHFGVGSILEIKGNKVTQRQTAKTVRA